MLRESNTIVVERNRTWTGEFATEPVEVGWAAEAIYFIRALDIPDPSIGGIARVQISPDGIHWCDEGAVLELPAGQDDVTFARVSHFGGWLRLVGELTGGGEITVMVYLSLKG